MTTAADDDFATACAVERFDSLQPAAARELAHQISTRTPDATALTALGFGWALALEVQRAILSGGSATLLSSHGMPAAAAAAIATAANLGHERWTAAVYASAPARQRFSRKNSTALGMAT
jgi:hypothetical protein